MARQPRRQSSFKPFALPVHQGPLERPVRDVTRRLEGRLQLPQDWFDNLWGHVVGCPDSNCTSGYDTKAYDSLVDKADSETGDQAIAAYKKLNQMLIDDVAYIPLYYSKRRVTCSSRTSRERGPQLLRVPLE